MGHYFSDMQPDIPTDEFKKRVSKLKKRIEKASLGRFKGEDLLIIINVLNENYGPIELDHLDDLEKKLRCLGRTV